MTLIKLNEEHIWGCYYELIVNDNCVQRTVFLEKGGTNSLHRHETEEWMTVVEGTVKFVLGKDVDSLKETILPAGGTIYVPKNYWHQITYIDGNYELKGCKTAIINETMLGNHHNGKYKIERYWEAKRSDSPKHIAR